MKQILLIEDDPAIADPLAYALAREHWQVVWRDTGIAALEALQQQAFDCIILDVGLPDTDGFELCRRIRRDRATPLIFLTARNEEVDRIVGLELGADDYCGKPFSSRELISRIKAVCRRSEGQGRAADVWQVNEDAQTISYHGQTLDLTRYEYRLLRHLLTHAGQTFDRDRLVNTLWDHPDHIDNRTVDSHIKTLRQKLRAIAPDADPIRTRRGYGYVLER
ncbi:two-component system response regulator CreB [uncultured Cardiobacterium sp.]|uniref:two-component system response regulator CreB n=1 Tax=uncultured Cardiobacterium sp. TaxID=417619 RepID=UPI002618EC07|nr:two-component system response regulator CreB [uncultured Cardiobacterium sp.]